MSAGEPASSPSAAEALAAGVTESREVSKEEALASCAGQHSRLIECYRSCGFLESLGGCCKEEHKVFWGCYTEARGTNQTLIASWLSAPAGGARAHPDDGRRRVVRDDLGETREG